jgi:signal transduction histidine kinase
MSIPAIPFLRRLHVRAALAVVPVLFALASAMSWLGERQANSVAQQAAQRLNLGLAGYIVAHQPVPLVDAAGRINEAAVRVMATQAMMINPVIEVYLLDGAGVVRAHALDGLGAQADPIGRAVDLAPVRALAAGAEVALPVLGDDPRQPGRRVVISVAALPAAAGGASPGWLYVVLQGAAAQTQAEALGRARRLPDSALMAALATSVAGAVLVLALVRLTRPLHRLAQRVQDIRREDDEQAPLAAGDEIALLESAVCAMQARIEHQWERLREADRMRRELVGNISHDLRTPLSSIQGYVETVLLRADRLDATAREQHLRTALRHADLLGRRIADLFHLSTLDAGQVAPVLETFCIAELLQDVVASYRLDAQRRGVKIELDGGSHTTTTVRADIGLIERVLQNLVDNALRHTPRGGAVTLALAPVGTRVEVSVRDTGSGIARDHLPFIFERYWRADEPGATRPPPTGSSGLGLAIVKRIVELHDSVVQVRSEPHEGTCFAFRLMLASSGAKPT